MEREEYDENEYVERIVPRNLSELLRAVEMIERAEKYENNNEVLMLSETGEKSFVNYSHFVEGMKSNIEDYRNQHNTKFDSNILSQNIAKLLKDNDMRVSTLEKILDISPGYISRATGEDAKRRLSIDIVYEIAALFKVSLDWMTNIDASSNYDLLRPAIDFIYKLLNQTINTDLIWENIAKDKYICKTWEDYLSFRDGEGDESSIIYETGTTYFARTNMGEIIVAPIMPEDEVDSGYFVGNLTFVSQELSVGEVVGDISEIFLTTDDKDGVLSKCMDDLYNEIESQNIRYHISEESKKFIDGYMSSYAGGDGE